jgi:hypothetical protein
MNDFKDKEGIDLIDIQALQRLEAAEKQKWNYLLLKNNYSLTIHYC